MTAKIAKRAKAVKTAKAGSAAKKAGKPEQSRAKQHRQMFGTPHFSEGQFIEQVNGFGTPVVSHVRTYAGV